MTDAISEPALSPTCEPLPGCRICAPNRRRHLDRGTVRDAELGHSPGSREGAGLEPPASLWACAALDSLAAVVLVLDGLGYPTAELDPRRTHALALRQSRLARRGLRRPGGRAAVASFLTP
jgi:hypothetical protein